MADDAATHGRGPPDAGASRERRLDARRNVEAIVEAARRTLAADPGASVQDVARAAGLHRATVHRHFASRGALVAELRRRASAESLAALRDAHPDDGPALDALRRATVALVAVGDRWGGAGMVASGAATGEPAALGAALMRRGQEERAIRGDVAADRLATVWEGAIAGAGALRERRIEPAELADVLARLLAAPARPA